MDIDKFIEDLKKVVAENPDIVFDIPVKCEIVYPEEGETNEEDPEEPE